MKKIQKITFAVFFLVLLAGCAAKPDVPKSKSFYTLDDEIKILEKSSNGEGDYKIENDKFEGITVISAKIRDIELRPRQSGLGYEKADITLFARYKGKDLEQPIKDYILQFSIKTNQDKLSQNNNLIILAKDIPFPLGAANRDIQTDESGSPDVRLNYNLNHDQLAAIARDNYAEFRLGDFEGRFSRSFSEKTTNIFNEIAKLTTISSH